MLPRKRSVPPGENPPPPAKRHSPKQAINSMALLAFAPIVVLLVYTLPWARKWLWSGCACETILVLYGSSSRMRILPSIPLWPLLTTLNLVYAICSTSWLLYALFAAFCYPLIFMTCLYQSSSVANFARKTLRKLLQELHFTRDKIALFNLPALEIDADVDGLMVVRGMTISLSSLTIVAHGIELGIKLTEDIELALLVEEVTINLFRGIEIGDVYGNIKGGEAEMTLLELESDSTETDSQDVFVNNTPLLRAATAGSEMFNDRPKLRSTLTGGREVQDLSPQAILHSVTALSPDDEVAEKRYLEILKEIRTTGAVYQSRERVRQREKEEEGYSLGDEKDWRAAICSELHQLPSITHAPDRSIKVTTIQRLMDPRLREFLHRLPFLLRLLLSPLGYFHPINIASFNAAGSGQWLTALLQQKVFKQYATQDAEIRRLERRISTWLADANFCIQLTDVDGLGQVPILSDFDITTYLHFADIMAYRSVTQAGSSTQVVRLGGADATFTIPTFLLPHHEHILPHRPSEADQEQQSKSVGDADGLPKTFQAEQKLEQMQKDQAVITMSVHARLPAVFDQSLLNFVAALVKATKIIEMEKQADDVEQGEEPGLPVADDASIASVDSKASTASGGRKAFNKIHQSLKDGSARDSIKQFAKDLHQSTRDGMKKAVVQGMVNDRWIAKMVGKIALKLENAKGDVGYSGEFPVPLTAYRPVQEIPSKLMP